VLVNKFTYSRAQRILPLRVLAEGACGIEIKYTHRQPAWQPLRGFGALLRIEQSIQQFNPSQSRDGALNTCIQKLN
jgi:hypothetical protein